MTFESGVIAFSERFLSQRTFELIVEPALADLQFDEAAGRRSRWANRLAVLRAVAGGIRDGVWRELGSALKLSIVSASYFMYPLAFGFDYFKGWSRSQCLIGMAVVIALSLVPVMVCYWPQRHTVRHGD